MPATTAVPFCTSVTVSVQPGSAAPVPVLAVVQVTVSVWPDTRAVGACTCTGCKSGCTVVKLALSAVLLASRPPSLTTWPASVVTAIASVPSGMAGSVTVAVTV